jgi:hypothetical protein
MPPTRIALALLVSLATPSWPRLSLADPPPAEFTIEFDGDAAIWNPFEGFSACESFSGATLCLFLDGVVCNGAGQCFGYADVEFSGILNGSGSSTFEGNAKCVASSNPEAPVCKANLLIEELIGTVNFCGFELSNFKVKGPVDSAGFFEGKASTQLCLECPGAARECVGAKGLFEYPVNPPMNWSLTVQVNAVPKKPKKFVGTADDSLGFSYTAKGAYNPKKDEATIILQGVTKKADPDSVSQGAKIKLEKLHCQAGQCTGGTANIKVQGNKINDTPIGP